MASILAFRPSTVRHRLPARSQACPLGLREVLAGGRETLPLVRASAAGVARAALLAAKQERSVLGLALSAPAGVDPWFAAVAREADELAPSLPIFLSGEVVVGSGSEAEIDRAVREAWGLVEGGVTHLAIDVQAVEGGHRAAVARRLAQPARELELGLDLALPGMGGRPSPAAAAELLRDLRAGGVIPDIASARWPQPRDEEEAGLQAAQLAELCRAIAPIPILRRGMALLALLDGTLARVVEDGGAAEEAARRSLARWPDGSRARVPEDARLPPEIGDRAEAMAYLETHALLEALGAAGSAARLRLRLERAGAERQE